MYDLWSVDVPMQRWPIANWLLILFIVITSNIAWSMMPAPKPSPLFGMAHRLENGKLSDKEKRDLIEAIIEESRKASGSHSIPGTLHPGQFRWYQLFTSIVVHHNLAHLVGNLVFLFIFGNAINAKLGHGCFLLCFVIIGMIENILWLLYGGGRSSLGASAAIMGIVGLFFIFYPRNDIKMVWWFYGIEVDHYHISAFWIILLYLGCDLIGAIWFGNAGVGFLSHLVGAGMGMAIGITMLRTGWLEPVYEEENLLQCLGIQERLKRWE